MRTGSKIPRGSCWVGPRGHIFTVREFWNGEVIAVRRSPGGHQLVVIIPRRVLESYRQVINKKFSPRA